MRQKLFALLLTFVMAFTLTTGIAANAEEALPSGYINIFYGTNSGVKTLFKYPVTKGDQIILTKDMIPDYNSECYIETGDPEIGWYGIGATIYNESRDAQYGEKGPADVEAYLKSLVKKDTYQTGLMNPNIPDVYEFTDPAEGSPLSGTIVLNLNDKVKLPVSFINYKESTKTYKDPGSEIEYPVYTYEFNGNTYDLIFGTDLKSEETPVASGEGTYVYNTNKLSTYFVELLQSSTGKTADISLRVYDPTRPDDGATIDTFDIGNRVYSGSFGDSNAFVIDVYTNDFKTQTVTATPATKIFKYSKVKKKKQTYTIKAKSSEGTPIEYSSSNSKYVTVSNKGKVTVKKKAKKGTYKIYVTASETFDIYEDTKVVTYIAAQTKVVKVKVK